jgi:hypothetical protein
MCVWCGKRVVCGLTCVRLTPAPSCAAHTAKQFVDATFQYRHKLINGNNLDTIRTYAAENPTVTFDVVFIDGGHYGDVPMHDTIN